MKLMLYSLRTAKNGKPELNYGLTNCLTDFYNHQSNTLEIKLPSGVIFLPKWDYLNKLRVIDTGKEFFLVANKQLDSNAAKNYLLRYSIEKAEKRKSNLDDFINKCKNELVAA